MEIPTLTLLHLLHKASTLIDGIVQLGVGVCQLAVAHKQLKTLSKAGIDGRTERYPTNTRQYVANVLLSQDLGTVPEDFHTIAASFTIDDGTPTAKYYLDGNLVSTKTSTDSIVVGGTLYLRIYPNNIFKRWTRYARVLTAAEIAANYAIDKARFNLP